MTPPPPTTSALADAQPADVARDAPPRGASPSPGGAHRPRVLVVCPGPWDRGALAARADRYDLHVVGAELVESPTVLAALRFDALRWVRRTVEAWRGRGVEGVIGTGDYPACMLAALVAEGLGLPAPPPRLVVAFSHKHRSREIQRRVVPEATPPFEAIDPFSGHHPLMPLARPSPPRALRYPVFVKPVKGTMSIRARLVASDGELREALGFSLRERVEKLVLLRAFGQLLRALDGGAAPAHFFIAEAPLRGTQVTVDGFSQRGRATVMGVVDSVMYPGTSSFRRFDLPSRLPPEVTARMADLARRLLDGAGFDDGCWNVELFHDPATDAIHVIEVNPRMSYQFADLYERVDGTSTFDVALAIALGRDVRWRPGGGRDRVATSFVLRRFSDARVVRVPSPVELAAVRARFPGVIVEVLCAPGERLSSRDQDVGSYRYGIVNLGAASPEELDARYAEVERMLRFELA